jgi:chromosomal replication initiation ATPase DnaA
MTPQEIMRRLRVINGELAQIAGQLEHAAEVRKEFGKLADIQEVTAAEFGITLAMILGQSRRPECSRPRFAAMWLSQKLSDRSSHEIARAFNRDRTSFVHGVIRAEQLRADCPEYLSKVDPHLEQLSPLY